MSKVKSIDFSLEKLNELDSYALLAHQVYNLGDSCNWFSSFSGGLHGFYSRIYGVSYHYQHIYNWTMERKDSLAIEFHVSSLLFNMDSALECLTYAINALGCSIDPRNFKNVCDEWEISRVSPTNVIGKIKSPPLAGYEIHFPRFSQCWLENKELIEEICEQHDVSKHRETVFTGGQQRGDAPDNFFNKIGYKKSPDSEYYFSAWENIHLKIEPKKPKSQRTANAGKEPVNLEELCEGFRGLINRSCTLLTEDAIRGIQFQYKDFIPQKKIIYFPDIQLYLDEECLNPAHGVWGVILGTEFEGFYSEMGSIVPVTSANFFIKGQEYVGKTNFNKTWSRLWYIDPFSKEKKLAWEWAAEFIG